MGDTNKCRTSFQHELHSLALDDETLHKDTFIAICWLACSHKPWIVACLSKVAIILDGSYCCHWDRKRNIMTFFIVIVAVMIIIIIIPVLLGLMIIFSCLYTWEMQYHRVRTFTTPQGDKLRKKSKKRTLARQALGREEMFMNCSYILLWVKTMTCCLSTKYLEI